MNRSMDNASSSDTKSTIFMLVFQIHLVVCTTSVCDPEISSLQSRFRGQDTHELTILKPSRFLCLWRLESSRFDSRAQSQFSIPSTFPLDIASDQASNQASWLCTTSNSIVGPRSVSPRLISPLCPSGACAIISLPPRNLSGNRQTLF